MMDFMIRLLSQASHCAFEVTDEVRMHEATIVAGAAHTEEAALHRPGPQPKRPRVQKRLPGCQRLVSVRLDFMIHLS